LGGLGRRCPCRLQRRRPRGSPYGMGGYDSGQTGLFSRILGHVSPTRPHHCRHNASSSRWNSSSSTHFEETIESHPSPSLCLFAQGTQTGPIGQSNKTTDAGKPNATVSSRSERQVLGQLSSPITELWSTARSSTTRTRCP
jgi:hypothetical protein